MDEKDIEATLGKLEIVERRLHERFGDAVIGFGAPDNIPTIYLDREPEEIKDADGGSLPESEEGIALTYLNMSALGPFVS
jgi:hypothetical protein